MPCNGFHPSPSVALLQVTSECNISSMSAGVSKPGVASGSTCGRDSVDRTRRVGKTPVTEPRLSPALAAGLNDDDHGVCSSMRSAGLALCLRVGVPGDGMVFMFLLPPTRVKGLRI